MPQTQSFQYAEQKMNIRFQGIQICKTVILLEKPYAASYLARVLTGDTGIPLKDDLHQSLETFGSLNQLSRSKTEDIIYYLHDQGWLKVVSPTIGTLELTEVGQQFLQNPADLSIARKQLFRKWYQTQLGIALKSWRKQAAGQLGVSPYEVFTNHIIQLIVRQLPATEEAWQQLPGLEALTSLQLAEIKEIVQLCIRKKVQDEETGIYTKAYSPSHRKIKELYQAGFSLDEMAHRRKLKPSTVSNYLTHLHMAGEIDLKPWIETHLTHEDLHKGVSYFRSAKDRRLKTAHQTLALDYETLRWCQTYTAQVLESEEAYEVRAAEAS